jgi:ABC-type long-subunit fatty acid transport system fused permease/ATPase subunit
MISVQVSRAFSQTYNINNWDMAMVLTAVYKRFRYFKEGQQSLKDVLQKGRKSTAAHNVEIIACIQEVI